MKTLRVPPPLSPSLFVPACVLSFAGIAHGQQTPVQLPAIVVESGGSPATSDTYFAPVSRSATKTDTPVLETPQSVSSVTRKQMDDQNVQTVTDALRHTAGVLSADASSRYDTVFLRGFGAFGTSTQYVSFLDGMKLPRGQAFANSSVDPFFLDRIDVLKGPSALLYGQTSPGGLVNQVSRQPQRDRTGEARIETGSHGRVQGGFTQQGSLDESGVWQYSISAVGRSSGTRYHGVREERYGVAPALTWRPSARTRLTLSAYYQHDPRGGYFNSMLARGAAPSAYRSRLDSKLNIGDSHFDGFDREQYGIGYDFEHRFGDSVAVQSKLRYAAVDIDFQSLQMSGRMNAAGLIPRHALRSIERAGGITADNNVRVDLRTGALAHRVIAGLDYQHTSSDWEYRFGAASPLDVTAPSYGQPVGTLATIIDNRQRVRQLGAYLQDQISIGRWHAVLGLRHDWTSQRTDNHLRSKTSRQDSEATSYRAALLYSFDNGISPYASYATSFEPTVGVGADGSPFVPTKARQYELGVKYQPRGTDALFTVSAFDIRQKNVLTPGSVPGFNVQTGEVGSRGIELEARGKLTDSLEVVASATFLDTEIRRSGNAAAVGKRPQAVPRRYGSLWLNYSVPGGPLRGLTAGAGVRAVAASYGDDANTLRSPGYAVVDAALSYDLGALNPAAAGALLTLNVTNLLNKEYYASCSSGFYCQFGNERQVIAGLRYRW